jgi:hypothetical protein
MAIKNPPAFQRVGFRNMFVPGYEDSVPLPLSWRQAKPATPRQQTMPNARV